MGFQLHLLGNSLDKRLSGSATEDAYERIYCTGADHLLRMRFARMTNYGPTRTFDIRHIITRGNAIYQMPIGPREAASEPI